VEALRKENNNVYTAAPFRTPKMSLCTFLEQKPQYAGTFSNFGNFPKKCPIHPVSECNPTWLCIPNPYVSYIDINLKYNGSNFYVLLPQIRTYSQLRAVYQL
jgi:hypothetical protein